MGEAQRRRHPDEMTTLRYGRLIERAECGRAVWLRSPDEGLVQFKNRVRPMPPPAGIAPRCYSAVASLTSRTVSASVAAGYPPALGLKMKGG